MALNASAIALGAEVRACGDGERSDHVRSDTADGMVDGEGEGYACGEEVYSPFGPVDKTA